jgi:hypothetical protein
MCMRRYRTEHTNGEWWVGAVLVVLYIVLSNATEKLALLIIVFIF